MTLSIDFVDRASAVAPWLAARFDHLAPATERDAADAEELSAAIERLVVATADETTRRADDVDTVNLFAATPDVPPVLDGGRRRAGGGQVRIAQALSSIARDAIAILAADDGRIRRCAGCGRVFHDDSRTGNRRWCSMLTCGNRAKVAAFRARQRVE
ncbi:CGNR zinc finger domain-containing protein [Pseudolysinimonas sp.]|uniref:CGNR zinc finger domain-containing protein n=1 Tax=Pseudolysinimonas sp. TaxID=2680009 RepID=UPI003F80B0BC